MAIAGLLMAPAAGNAELSPAATANVLAATTNGPAATTNGTVLVPPTRTYPKLVTPSRAGPGAVAQDATDPAAPPPEDVPPAEDAAPGEAPAQPTEPTPAAPVHTWLPRGTALLQALDKVNAQTASLTVPVGQSATYGSLTIAVKGCVVRPPDQPQDAAALLDITDSHADQPGFSGWMLRSAPSVSMLQHPIYDIRVVGCGT